MDRQLVCLAVSVLYKEMGKSSRKATSPRVVPQSPHESHEIWYSVHAQSSGIDGGGEQTCTKPNDWAWCSRRWKRKTAVVQMAKAEGGLSQSALVRRLIRNAARERGIWPPDKPKHTIEHIREVQRG